MNIYVGNLSYSVTEDDLKQAFEAFGQVASVSIIKDKFSNQSKGFDLSKCPRKKRHRRPLPDERERTEGRAMNVNEARPARTTAGVAAAAGARGQIPFLASGLFPSSLIKTQ